jgi:hypothetical protein
MQRTDSLLIDLERPDNGPHRVTYTNAQYNLTWNRLHVVDSTGHELGYDRLYVTHCEAFTIHNPADREALTYISESVYDVDGTEVTIRELPEDRFLVIVRGAEYPVWPEPWGDERRWYTEVDGRRDGPWKTVDDLLDEMFLGRRQNA